MKRTEHVVTYLAFGLLAAFVTLASLFIVGETFNDPGGWAAVGLVLLWLVPMLALGFVAYRWPSVAVWVLSGAVVLVAGSWLWYALDTASWKDLMNDVGPVLGVGSFVLLLPIGVLGLRRRMVAGVMLVSLAVLSYASFLASVRDEPWRGLSDSLTTSSTITVVPTLALGLLFLLAALLRRMGGSAPPEVPPTAPRPPVAAGRPVGGSTS